MIYNSFARFIIVGHDFSFVPTIYNPWPRFIIRSHDLKFVPTIYNREQKTMKVHERSSKCLLPVSSTTNETFMKIPEFMNLFHEL